MGPDLAFWIRLLYCFIVDLKKLLNSKIQNIQARKKCTDFQFKALLKELVIIGVLEQEMPEEEEYGMLFSLSWKLNLLSWNFVTIETHILY